jgi:hypothetical protein
MTTLMSTVHPGTPTVYGRSNEEELVRRLSLLRLEPKQGASTLGLRAVPLERFLEISKRCGFLNLRRDIRHCSEAGTQTNGCSTKAQRMITVMLSLMN